MRLPPQRSGDIIIARVEKGMMTLTRSHSLALYLLHLLLQP